MMDGTLRVALIGSCAVSTANQFLKHMCKDFLNVFPDLPNPAGRAYVGHEIWAVDNKSPTVGSERLRQ